MVVLDSIVPPCCVVALMVFSTVSLGAQRNIGLTASCLSLVTRLSLVSMQLMECVTETFCGNVSECLNAKFKAAVGHSNISVVGG